MEARPHPLQADRLRALHDYEVLDTAREKDFDDIAQLAAKVCDAPIAVVNLIDADRQWFKAETGLGTRETPIATSICAHVILEHEFVEIHDTLQDPRMIDNPLCCGDPGLRFYAGALLTTPEGLPIGTLCVLDYQPRQLTPLQRDCIKVLARQVMAQLDLRKSLRQANTLRQEVDHRVKNSLQSVAAYIRLHKATATSPEAMEALDAVQLRIAAVSQLHEQLYRTDAGPTIDLGTYIGNLGEYLASFAPPAVKVQINVGADRALVPSQQASAVGTLINELAANAFKHAFPAERAGTLAISLDRTNANLVRLVCSDDGVGLPSVTQDDGKGLGMRVIQAVCSQLNTTLDVVSSTSGVMASAQFAIWKV